MQGITSEIVTRFDPSKGKFILPTIDEVSSGEIVQNYYTEYYKVQKGDIVVDIGAYLGNNIIDFVKMGARCFALEPMKKNYDYILKSLRKENIEDSVVLINKAISDVDGATFAEEKNTDSLPTKDYTFAVLTNTKTDFMIEGITLKTLVEENGIDCINLLKMDCEGGEYRVFTNENYDYIKNNVRNVALEFHARCGLASNMEKAINICKKMKSLNFDVWVHRIWCRWNSNGVILSEKLHDNITKDFLNNSESIADITTCMFYAKNNNFIGS